MSEDLHSRAKKIFLRAIDLSPEDRVPYVNDACNGDLDLRTEVLGLLNHHHSATLQLGGSLLRTVVGWRSEQRVWWRWIRGEREAGQPRVAVAAEAPQMSDETSRLLRQRLRGMTLVLNVVLASVLLADVVRGSVLLIEVRAIILGVVLSLCTVLHSRLRLATNALRTLELAVLFAVGIQLIAVQSVSMVRSANRGDSASTLLAASWNFTGWSLLILFYGTFVPNKWKRAVAVLLPTAAVPLLVILFVGGCWEPVSRQLKASGLGMLWIMPPLASLTAVYAAHLYDSARRAAFEARQFGQYRLTEKLGGGGMGEVYKAEHLLLKRRCALKLIRPELVTDPKFLTRFEREVRATARLTHWNTIQIYDFGQSTDGEFYYVMELLDGLNLAEVVCRSGPLPPARAVYFLRQVCAALQEAHASGLVHRDIKPANIFAARLGGVYDVAKLLDFGVVQENAASCDARLTTQGVVVGTSQYMSPEQAVASPEITPKADLYSLGAVAYFLLTERPPFVRNTIADVLMAHVRDTVTRPSHITRNLPRDLEEVVLRCLAKRPDDRFPTANALERALAACGCADQWSQEQAAAWWCDHGSCPAQPRCTTPLT